MTWRETLETALARGTAGQLAPAIRDALAFIDAREAAGINEVLSQVDRVDDAVTGTFVRGGVFRTAPSGARIEIDDRSTRHYDVNGELLWEWLNTPVVHLDQDEPADGTTDRPMPAWWVLDPVTEAEIRALGLDDGPVQ